MKDDQRHVGFTESVLRRPTMYTLGGTFLEVLAFLEGYYGGLSKGNVYNAPVCEWESFREWLAARLEVSPQEAFERVWQSQGDSAAALASTLEWLEQYERERSAS